MALPWHDLLFQPPQPLMLSTHKQVPEHVVVLADVSEDGVVTISLPGLF